LDFLATAGPRLTGLYLDGSSENLRAETPDISWKTPYGIYHLVGGHRLWIAPESFDHTAVPDDHGLGITELDDLPVTALRLPNHLTPSRTSADQSKFGWTPLAPLLP
jgi:hypothetical protein